MHLRGSSLENCPGDDQFLSSLDSNNVPDSTMAQRRYSSVVLIECVADITQKHHKVAFSTLMFGCGFPFPLSSSHFIVPVHLGSLDGASRTTLDATPLIRCISPMSSVSRLSHPFHLPVPRNLEFVVAANLFE